MTKGKTFATWTISVLLGLSFLAAGWPKVLPNDNMVARFENWGYTAEFASLIGVLEILAGLLVLVPRTALYGAMLIGVLMTGAIYTHLSTAIGSPLFAIIYALMAVALGILRYGVAIKPKR
ncbi:MAG: DoxX family protein [Sphingomonadales bacterium]|nr:DoxX family protein [Sphingomonadales bacterium]